VPGSVVCGRMEPKEVARFGWSMQRGCCLVGTDAHLGGVGHKEPAEKKEDQ